MERIIEDLESMIKKLGDERLIPLKEKLVKLHESGGYHTRHSCMELVCANYLFQQGYKEVDVEHSDPPFSEKLAIDVWGRKSLKTIGIEVEGGSIPPEYSTTPESYLEARILSKIARYSPRVDEFGLGFLLFYRPEIPKFFIKPREKRTQEEIKNLEERCGRYYKNPPISRDELLEGKLNYIYIIYVEAGRVLEISPQEYIKSLPLRHFSKLL